MKKKPQWDSAFFMARANPEWRQRQPRESGPIIVPDVDFDPVRAIAAWRAIGVEVSESRIRRHMRELEAWETGE